ncbi:pfs domain-containing protein [Colletotrichum salicis]|uniref:Pfs domain-containing protein n=1 Tax=Colletotrichum salicis TaxID=1209931 RepID=A0A135SUG4_9PEZI|nr:pfs domain-containing protein [Colletotrichum salicis]
MDHRQSFLETTSAKRSTCEGRTRDEGPNLVKRQKVRHGENVESRLAVELERDIRLRHINYTVGWICALPIEMAAARAMLDRIHEDLPTRGNNTNPYILGNVGKHNIAMACLPAGQYGTNNAAIVASNMRRTFKSIRIRLMVGIGGGVPGNIDLRLGDVVVGDKVLQYDLGKNITGNRIQRTGTARVPPHFLLNAVSKLRAIHETRPCRIPAILQDMHKRHHNMAGYVCPSLDEDRLFRVTYDHEGSNDCKNCQHPLICFIDALDECDEEQVREMMTYFEGLVEGAAENNILLKICFSSRPYPNVNVIYGLKLVIEDQPGHGQDLERYVERNLRMSSSQLADNVRSRILEKAAGIFIWVVLVVQVLNREIARGRMSAVESRLDELPAQLSELFRDILTRDKDNVDELLLCIQWILFAERPLTRSEFYFAMLSRLPEHQEILAAQDLKVTNECMDRYVISSSKGLAETLESGFGTIQFIHESVKDFLIKNGGYQELWPGVGANFHSLSHEQLKQLCYSNLVACTRLAFAKILTTTYLESWGEKRQIITEAFPFIEYSVQHVLYHADAAAKHLSQDDFLIQFSLEDWALACS